MKIFKIVDEIRGKIQGGSLGFVATMGALHKGHGVLIERSKEENEKTCVSIFVNPAQFNNARDFETYPDKTLEDIEYCKSLGVDYVFMPEVLEIYGELDTVQILEDEITKDFEGACRQGHFNGVLQVVMKLLNIIQPTKAYFGEKDYQQYLVVKKMSEQFFMKPEIIGVPIYREKSGLALSSRNFNLSDQGFKKAREIAGAFLKTKSKEEFLSQLGNNIDLEYYGECWGRVLMAHYVDGVRLIDNKNIGGV